MYSVIIVQNSDAVVLWTSKKQRATYFRGLMAKGLCKVVESTPIFRIKEHLFPKSKFLLKALSGVINRADVALMKKYLASFWFT